MTPAVVCNVGVKEMSIFVMQIGDEDAGIVGGDTEFGVRAEKRGVKSDDCVNYP